MGVAKVLLIHQISAKHMEEDGGAKSKVARKVQQDPRSNAFRMGVVGGVMNQGAPRAQWTQQTNVRAMVVGVDAV